MDATLLTLIIANIILLYFVCCWIACGIHMRRDSRAPTGVFDFIRMTFLPYVWFCLWRKKGLD